MTVCTEEQTGQYGGGQLVCLLYICVKVQWVWQDVQKRSAEEMTAVSMCKGGQWV